MKDIGVYKVKYKINNTRFNLKLTSNLNLDATFCLLLNFAHLSK